MILIVVRLKQELTERGKLLLGYAVAGIAFSLLVTLTTNLISGVLNTGFASSISGIITALISGNPMAMIMIFLTTLIFGVFIWIFGYVGALLKTKVSGGSVKLSTRPHIIGFFLVGALGVIAFAIVDEALIPFGASNDALSLVDDLFALQIMAVVIKIVGFAIIGAVAIWLGSKFTTLESYMPDAVKKI